MYDTQITIRQGDKSPGFGIISVPTGTVTISSATFQLLNADHTVFSGGTDFSTPVTASHDSGSGTSKNVWYDLLDTDTSLMIPGSWYIGRFVVLPTVSDSIVRKTVLEVQIVCVW